MMKKFASTFILIFALFVFPLCGAQAAEQKGGVTYQNSYTIEKSEKAKLRSFIKNLNKYSNEHNIEALKAFYSKDYISFDGFNYDVFMASIKETFQTYPDITYKNKIKSVNVYNNEAVIELYDVTTSNKEALTQAIINNLPVSDIKIKGRMESKCHYVIYLKKTGGKWQIYSDYVISEETAIKYGSANDIGLQLTSPLNVKKGEEYSISLNVDKKPKNSIVLASLSREEIKYPPDAPIDKFKKIPSSGLLERVVRANKEGINEYSLASVGIAEIFLNKEKTAINYKTSGMAFMMKRINLTKEINSVSPDYLKKIEKEKL